MTRYKLIYFIIFLCIAKETCAANEIEFAYSKLQNLYLESKLELAQPDSDTTIVVSDSLFYPIRVTFEKKMVSHLGICIFDEDYKQATNPELLDFVERYALELMMIKDQEKREEHLYYDKVWISGELGNLINSDKTHTFFNLTIDATKRYLLRWYTDKEDIFSISFPAEYELISGKNKIELEDDFFHQLQKCHHKRNGYCFDHLSPVRLNEKLFVVDKGSYILQNIRSRTYLVKENDTFQLLYDIDYPLETIENILSYGTEKNMFSCNITLNKYGFERTLIKCPYNDLIEYMRESGCTPYIAFTDISEDNVKAFVLMKNEEMGYNHLFDVNFNRGLLSSRRGEIQLEMRVYIPTHNLTDLYDYVD